MSVCRRGKRIEVVVMVVVTALVAKQVPGNVEGRWEENRACGACGFGWLHARDTTPSSDRPHQREDLLYPWIFSSPLSA